MLWPIPSNVRENHKMKQWKQFASKRAKNTKHSKWSRDDMRKKEIKGRHVSWWNFYPSLVSVHGQQFCWSIQMCSCCLHQSSCFPLELVPLLQKSYRIWHRLTASKWLPMLQAPSPLWTIIYPPYCLISSFLPVPSDNSQRDLHKSMSNIIQ
jgi:hypothetical protein